MDSKYQGGGAALLIALLLGGLLYSECSSYWANLWIIQDGHQLPAAISAERPHDVFEYEYVANGVHYIGQGLKGENLSRDPHVGDPVLVWTSSSHPRFSSLEWPSFPPWEPPVIIVSLICMEFFVVRTLVRMYRSSNQSPQSATRP